MKTTIIRIAFATILLVTIGSFSAKAQNNPDFFFDRKYENETLVSKTKYELGYAGLFEQTYRYTYSYDAFGKLTQEETFKWNDRKSVWEPVSCIEHIYDILENTVTIEHRLWNKSDMKYNKTIQYVVYQLDEQGNLISYTTGKGDNKSGEKMTMF